MSGVADWLRARGLSPREMRKRSLAGVVLGLTVVAVDHVLRMGS